MTQNSTNSQWPNDDGEIVIGYTGQRPVAATLTEGTGVTISNGNGSITINATGAGLDWNVVAGTSANMVADNGYIANNAGLVTLTLPTTCAVGTVIMVQGYGSGLFSIAQNASQVVHFGAVDTTTGVAGSITALNRYDSIALLCVVADLEWTVLTGPQGNFTVV